MLTEDAPTENITNNPVVSAITIFLNAEQFLVEAIESVLAQTYGDWELLLVNDGSTDRSGDIAQAYAQKYPHKIKCLAHPAGQNLGMSATRNLGIQHARGRYVAFLDADDIWLPLKLEKQVAILETDAEAAMVFGPSLRWYSWSDRAEDKARDWMETVSDRTNTLIAPPTLFLASMLEQRVQSASTCSLLVRREVLDELGGFEEQFRGLYEDQVFLTKVYAQKTIYVMEDCLDFYRQHPNSCVSRSATRKKQDTARLRFLLWVEHYLTQQDLNQPNLWQAFHEAIWPYRYPWLHRFQEMAVPVGRRMLPSTFREWLWARWSHRKQPISPPPEGWPERSDGRGGYRDA